MEHNNKSNQNEPEEVERVEEVEHMEEVEQVQDGAAVVATRVRETSYGGRIRLLFAMALLGGVSAVFFGVLIDPALLRIIMDYVVDPIADDTPFLFRYGADLSAEYFDRGLHVPVEFGKTDIALITDFQDEGSLGICLDAFTYVPCSKMPPSANGVKIDEEVDEIEDLHVDFKRLRVTMRHPHFEEFRLLRRARRNATPDSRLRGPLYDVRHPLTGKFIIYNISNNDWFPQWNVSDDDAEEGGNVSGIVNLTNDLPPMYETDYYDIDSQLEEMLK